MLQSEESTRPRLALLRALIASVFLVCLTAAGAAAQTQTETATVSTATAVTAKPETAKTSAPPMPLVQDYQGIKIGMTADEVRDKLGKPASSDETGLFYEFSDDERAQIGLDADKKVRLIVAFYAADHAKRPQYSDVFGTDAPAPAKEDGSVYNLIQYPQAGYWVAYSKAAGKDALVIVTMQKL